MMISWSSVILSALMGSCAILASLYFLLPALGMPRLDFNAIASGWIGATGRNARLYGVAVYLIGGLIWAYHFARFWPIHGAVGGMLYGLVPFALTMALTAAARFKPGVTLYPVPGFIWFKAGGTNTIIVNLVQHLLFGLVLGLLYRA
jgi:hypothetical protein